MATSVGNFLSENGNVPEEECFHLGLTFSFPVEQTALASGTLLTWTKGFSATGAVGQDVVQLLQDAFNRNGVQVKCVALVNDVRPHALLRVYNPLSSHQTVGTLLTGAYSSGGCLLGAIFGTGTNGAYVEDQGALKKLSGNTAVPGDGQKMIINCEWGAFDNAVSFPVSTIKGNLPYHPYQPTAKSSPSVSIRHKARSRIHQSVCVSSHESSRDA
jgi:hexokinase